MVVLIYRGNVPVIESPLRFTNMCKYSLAMPRLRGVEKKKIFRKENLGLVGALGRLGHIKREWCVEYISEGERT